MLSKAACYGCTGIFTAFRKSTKASCSFFVARKDHLRRGYAPRRGWRRGLDYGNQSMGWKMIAAVSIKEQTESFHLIRAGLLKLATTEDDALLIEVANEFIRADPEKRYLVELALESILKRKQETTATTTGVSHQNSHNEHKVIQLEKRKWKKVKATSYKKYKKVKSRKRNRYDWNSIFSSQLWEDDAVECQKTVFDILHNVMQRLESTTGYLSLHEWWKEWEYFVNERRKRIQKQVVVPTGHHLVEIDRSLREKRVVQVLERIQEEEEEVTIKEIEMAANTVARLLDYRDSYRNNNEANGKKGKGINSRRVDSLNTYLSEIGQVNRLSLVEEKVICEEIARLTRLEAVREDLRRKMGRLPRENEWAWEANLSVSELRGKLIKGRRAKNRMVAANLRLVICFAKRYRNRGVAFQDLVQEGSIGLIRGVEKYDAHRGFRFSTYASWWIRQGIHKALLECSRMFRLPVHVNEMIKDIRKCSLELMTSLGREPTKLEIAMKVALSLEMPIGHDMECRTTLADVVHSTGETPEENAVCSSLRYDLERALTVLNLREREIIRMRFGLDDGRTKSLGEVGHLFCVTRERVRQIETQALRKLRDPSCNIFLKEYIELISDERPGIRKPMAVVE
ncbi:RNA polymerase sigma factor SigA [Galdieria sulphuraria]|nr:RNA polymerase sigma factor SigA [Galdieria sulphuraria]